MTRVAVVGGGAVGVTVACDLARAGVETTLYERDHLGAGSSGRAAGLVYDAYAEDVDAAVGARAVERFRAFDAAGHVAFTECPYVFFARRGDDAAAEAVAASAARMRGHGRDVSTVDPDHPALAAVATDDVAAAAVAWDAGYVDPGDYVEAVGDLAADAGAEIRTGTPVRVGTDPPRVETGDRTDRVDAVVVAAGAHTRSVLAAAGVAVPLKPYRVQALVAGADYDGPMWFDASADVYLRPHPEGVLAGDGTVPEAADPETYDRTADDWFETGLTAELDRRLGAEVRVRESWAGLCVATPDGDPLVGEVAPGVFVAAGWQGHGFMRAPAVGELVADAVRGTGTIPGPFDPDRFDGDEEFDVAQGMTLE